MANQATQTINKLYEDLLGRAADQKAQYWYDEMQKDWDERKETGKSWDDIVAEATREIKSGEEYKQLRIDQAKEEVYNQELFRSADAEAGSDFWDAGAFERLGEEAGADTQAFDEEIFASWKEDLTNAVNQAPEAKLQDFYVETLGGPAGAEGLQYWLDPEEANPLHSGSDWDYGEDNQTNFGATFDPGSNNWLGIADPLGDAASTTGFMNNMTDEQVLESIIAHTDPDGNEFNSLSGNLQTFYNPEGSQFQEGTRANTIGADNEFFTDGQTSAGTEGVFNVADLLESTDYQLSDLQTIPELVDFDGDPETAPLPVATDLGAAHTGDTSVYGQELLDYMDVHTNEDGWKWDPRQSATAAPLSIGGGPAMGEPFINIDPENPYTGPGSEVPGAGGTPVDPLPPGGDPPPTGVDPGPPPPGQGPFGPTIPTGQPPGGGQPMPQPEPEPEPETPDDPGPGDGGPGGDYPGWPDYGYGGYDPVGGVRIRKPGRNYKNSSGWFSRSGKRLSSNPDLKIAPNNLNPVYT
jgi:hypothetical protein